MTSKVEVNAADRAVLVKFEIENMIGNWEETGRQLIPVGTTETFHVWEHRRVVVEEPAVRRDIWE